MTDRLAELGALRYAAENTATHATSPNRLAAAGYIHAAFAEYQTWAAANPGINPSRLSAKGRLFGYFYDNATFSPLSLFAASEQGAWYDPSDLTTMFQDSAGTTPVTTVGQNVLRINDKSGNGNHIIFGGAVTLQNDGESYYLQGTGGNGQTTSAVDMSAFDKMTIACAMKATTGASFFSFGNVTADSGSFDFGIQPDKKPLIYIRGSSGFIARYYGADIQDKFLNTVALDFAGADIATELPTFRINGNNVSSLTVNSVAGNGPLGNFPIKLFVGYGATFLGRFYGLVSVSRLLTAGELDSLESYMGASAGIPVGSTVLPYQLTPTSFTDSTTPINRTDYLETSAYASTVFDTTATEIEVVSYCTIASLFPDFSDVSVIVDGVFHDLLQQGGDGVNRLRTTLSAGSKRVTVTNGLQTQLSPIKGTFVTAINANASMSQVFPTPTNRLLIYGDSIVVGGNSANTGENAWAMQLRRSRWSDSTQIEAQGYRRLYDDSRDGTTRTAFVSKIQGINPASLWIEIGTNDYDITTWSAADFGTQYAALLDALHTAMPSLVIYCQTPTVRTSNSANTFGDTPQDYRDQISTSATARSSYCTLVDGLALLSVGNLVDGVHPGSTGHTEIFTNVSGILP